MKIDCEETLKRILSLNQMNVYLKYSDGHIWIYEDEESDECGSFRRILKNNKISLNSKIYGGVSEALDTIDEVLKLCNEKSLIERFNESYDESSPNGFFFGECGVDNSRIHVNEFEGGLF